MNTVLYSSRRVASSDRAVASARRPQASLIASPPRVSAPMASMRSRSSRSGGPISRRPSSVHVPARSASTSLSRASTVFSSIAGSLLGAEPARLGAALEVFGEHVHDAAVATHLQPPHGLLGLEQVMAGQLLDHPADHALRRERRAAADAAERFLLVEHA